MRWILRPLCLFLLCGSALMAAPFRSIEITPETASRLTVLGIQPLEATTQSQSQVWHLDAETWSKVLATGLPLTVVEDGRQVRVPGYVFDPIAEGEPNFSPNLRSQPGGEQLRLVQFQGRLDGEWLDGLAKAGAKPLQYYPHNTYLVWAEESRMDSVAELPFVRWQGAFHPAYKVSPELSAREGWIRQVDVMFYNDGGGDGEATLSALRSLGARILQTNPAQPDRVFLSAMIEADSGALAAMARLDTVVWMGYQSPKPILDDEMSAQIVAGNHPGGVPVTGYLAHLTTLGFDGTGVRWAITDSGVDHDHPDLNSRIVAGVNYPGCTPANPGDSTSSGHGTHVAGIVMGDASAGFTDANGFLYGMGIAPNADIVAQNPICPGLFSWPPAGGWQVLSKDAVVNGAVGSNNSWTSGEGTMHGYQASERTFDIMVRDGNFDTTDVAEPLVMVFSAGNSGTSGLTSPKDAKNLIATANSLNFRAGDINSISGSSSRGPAVDGRQIPIVAAPGSSIASARADGGGSCTTSVIAGTTNLYSLCSGTSMAAPHVSGAVVLITQWWRTMTGVDPSPALAKALLVNSAVDMATADIWRNTEGWGRINSTQAIAPTEQAFYEDQEVVLGTAGAEQVYNLFVDDPAKPLKITLAWSDAPGAVGANPALVNNLDLTVVTDGTTYLGNVFASGLSTTGGSADTINNLENVFVASPGATVEVRVTATAINGDGVPYNGDTTDQDFALVCSNCGSADIVFENGFETGDLSEWTGVVP